MSKSAPQWLSRIAFREMKATGAWAQAVYEGEGAGATNPHWFSLSPGLAEKFMIKTMQVTSD